MRISCQAKNAKCGCHLRNASICSGLISTDFHWFPTPHRNAFGAVAVRATLKEQIIMKRTLLILVLFCLLPSRFLAQEQGRASTQPPAPLAPDQLSTFGERIQIPGVSNTGKLNDSLYRGSQPKAEGFEQLKKLGITTVVDLRRQHQCAVSKERKRVEALGMHFQYIPASGWSPPKDEELVQFFTLFQQHPEEKFFVHCWLGDDRTGLFLGAYRIAFEHWTAERALQEMDFFHFKNFWHPSMRIYIQSFPAHFAQSNAFAPFRSQSSAQKDH
jgi:protein tyrosine phosphatase (PTP) superfamily phosphohydrolase (DUF442 family)